MFRYSSAIFVALLSFSAIARVSMEEKRDRVRFLESLSRIVPAIHVEGYHRELRYEELGLSLENRAENEALLMTEKIKQQVVASYEKAFEETSDEEEAKARVHEAIERDLELAEPDIRDSIKQIADKALEDAANGAITSSDEADPLQKYLFKEVKERSSFLNIETLSEANASASYSPIGNSSHDAEKLKYNSKEELVNSLVSDGPNVRWLAAASITSNSAVNKRAEANISYQLKINFLGVDISGGPTINFHRHYESRVMILSEGLNPSIINGGEFDFNKRDRSNKVIMSGGKAEKRYIAFYCELELNFNTDYSGSGSFSVVGIGGSTTYGQNYSNDVTMTSRRILVPEYVGNSTVTMPFLQKICLDDYLKAKINNFMTVKQSLNVQMSNIVASLRFSHPNTKCVNDSQCLRWFNSGMKRVVGNAGVPRCVEEPREKYFSCDVRSVGGQKCPVFKDGKHLSDGKLEYTCDKGLYCKKIKEGGWFQSIHVFDYAEGRCTPRGR